MQDIGTILNGIQGIKYFPDKSANLNYRLKIIRKPKQGTIEFFGLILDDYGLLNREEEVYLLKEINYYNYRVYKLIKQDNNLKNLIGLHNQAKRLGMLENSLDEEQSKTEPTKIINDCKDKFSKTLSRIDKEKIKELKLLYSKRQEAKEFFFGSNYKLIINVAKKYLGSHTTEIQDLFEEGVIGLDTAFKKFDLRKGCKYSTYTYWLIKQKIGRYTKNKSRLVRLPVYLQEKMKKYVETKIEVIKNNGNKTEEEILKDISKKLHISTGVAKRIEEIISQRYYSPDTSGFDWLGEEQPLHDLIPDGKDSIKEIETKNLKEVIKNEVCKSLQKFSPRSQEIIKFRYLNGEAKTLEETGNKFGLTRERIRQVEKKIFHKLKHNMSLKLLKRML